MGFEVYDVKFKRSQGQWREAFRDKNSVYQSKSEAIESAKDLERGWWEAVADDLEEQRERECIEGGWEPKEEFKIDRNNPVHGIKQIAERLQHAGPERDTLELNFPADRQILSPSIELDR